MKRLLVGVATGALLVGAAATGAVLLRQDRSTSPTASCERLPRVDLPPRGSSRLGDRLGLFVPGSGATRVGQARAIYIGDPGVGELAAAFTAGDCTYTVWFPAGTRMPAARAWLRAR